MSKVYKGYELLKAIEENKIEIGTRFKLNGYNNRTIIYKGGDIIRYEDDSTEVDSCYFINTEFELIEDEVDIDNIEDLLKIEEYEVDKTDVVINRNKINDLIQALKQLNKEIKSIKEK